MSVFYYLATDHDQAIAIADWIDAAALPLLPDPVVDGTPRPDLRPITVHAVEPIPDEAGARWAVPGYAMPDGSGCALCAALVALGITADAAAASALLVPLPSDWWPAEEP